MKKLRTICSILILAGAMVFSTACNSSKNTDSSSLSNNSSATTSGTIVNNDTIGNLIDNNEIREPSEGEEVEETSDRVYKEGVIYTSFRVIVDDALLESSLESLINANKGMIPDDLLRNSFTVNAYYYENEDGTLTTGDLIIADNTTDLMNNLNSFTVNEDFSKAIFTADDSTGGKQISIDIKVNENDEIYMVLDANNVIAIQIS